jgi:hypothetical protein
MAILMIGRLGAQEGLPQGGVLILSRIIMVVMVTIPPVGPSRTGPHDVASIALT